MSDIPLISVILSWPKQSAGRNESDYVSLYIFLISTRAVYVIYVFC